MFGIYINNNPLIAPFIGIYPTVELVADVVHNITELPITSREISASINLVGSFTYKDTSVEITVTMIPKELVDLCSRYDGSAIRVRTSLLRR
jgi:hypothetical protein